MPGILTMSPEQGGITELLCDMDECYRPRGRWDFEPIPNPMPMKIPEWIPTTDHFPKTKEVGGQKVAGNVPLAHRLCNRADYRPGSGIRRRLSARGPRRRTGTAITERHPQRTPRGMRPLKSDGTRCDVRPM